MQFDIEYRFYLYLSPFLSNGGIHILDKRGEIGLSISNKLKNILEQLNKEDDVNG